MVRVSADGLLLVKKPRGPTSHDIVAEARRLLKTRAVGHAGTLDPMASGLLVLLVGEATKLAAYLALDDKEYRATVQLGRSTDTLDAEGATTDERVLPDGAITDARIESALDAERLRTEQVPPSFSAISVDGKRAHRLARRGETVVLTPRPVAVRQLSLVTRSGSLLVIDVSVSKGYYVRSLARDLGAFLGAPAHLAALERRASGPYRLDDAAPWPPASLPSLVPLEQAAARALPTARLHAAGVARAICGKQLRAEHFDTPPGAGPLSAWLGPDGGLVALGRPAPDGYRVVRGFQRALAH